MITHTASCVTIFIKFGRDKMHKIYSMKIIDKYFDHKKMVIV